MRKILCTVGTSLQGNAARQGRPAADPAELCRFIIEKGPVEACAETNSLSRILRPGDRVLFLHSNTAEGRLCSAALVEYFRRCDVEAGVRLVDGLGYAQQTFMMRGLRELVDTLIDEIRLARRQEMEPVINATGGFKAEIAYATLVGLLFRVPVYYIHEKFNDIIEMPPIPVTWDYSLMVDYEDFFWWLVREPRRKEKVERRLLGLPAEIRMFLEEDQGYMMLSPAGEVYFQALCDLEASAAPVMVSESAHRYYDRLDETQKTAFNKAITKLRLEVLRWGGSGRVHDSDCLVFPRDNRAERIFYFEQEGTVYICELAHHGGGYEELLRSGVKREHYTSFQPLAL